MKKIVIALLCSIVLVSCKKYEEGPAFSFRSVSNRITGNWKVENFKVNGVDSTSALLNKIGDCHYSFGITKSKNQPMGGCGASGSWGLDKDKKKLGIWLYPHPSATPEAFVVTGSSYWTILRLTNKEMWIESNILNTQYNVRLKKSEDYSG